MPSGAITAVFIFTPQSNPPDHGYSMRVTINPPIVSAIDAIATSRISPAPKAVWDCILYLL
jgi:hypothetical protein